MAVDKPSDPMPTAPHFYPNLDFSRVDQNFMLTKIGDIQKRLEEEKVHRMNMYKKYHRGVNIVDGIVDGTVTGTGLSVVGMTLLATLVAAPIAIGCEVTAGVLGLLGIGGVFIRRKLNVKARRN